MTCDARRDVQGLARAVSSGRYLRVGLTWKSGIIGLVAILALIFASGWFLERVQTALRLDVIIQDERVVEVDGTCVWEIDIEAHNASERVLSLVSARLDGLDGSERSLLGAVEPAESIVRTYTYALPNCSTDPTAEGVTSLVVDFKPTGTGNLRSVTVPIE